jgi:DNA-binding PadR family transcriptional regulator
MAKPSAKTILPVKLCYSHIGGQLGSLLTEHFIASKWIQKTDNNERLYSITTKGKKELTAMGIDLSLITEIAID